MAQLDKSLPIGEILINLILEKLSFLPPILFEPKFGDERNLVVISLKVFCGKLFVRYNYQV